MKRHILGPSAAIRVSTRLTFGSSLLCLSAAEAACNDSSAINHLPCNAGELRETSLTDVARVAENLLPPHALADMFASFSSVAALLPQGGDAVWGNQSWSPDTPQDTGSSFGLARSAHSLLHDIGPCFGYSILNIEQLEPCLQLLS